jgi:hypothetical protein
MAETLTSISERVAAYVEALNGSSSDNHQFGTVKGRKYLKVVDGRPTDGGPLAGGSVHAFIEIATGNVYKAAGYNAPAKHVRFNLMDDASYARLIRAASSSEAYTTGYLYL